MKITVYTIKDCAFSKQEKEYLTAHNLQYEEKNLETNKDFLTEMLAVSNNFAGTPVTLVEKDDGSIAVLKGFTKEEFDTMFGFVAQTETSPKVEDVEPVTEVVSPVETTPPAPDPLKSVMDDLQSKSEPTVVPPVDQPTPTDSTDLTGSTVPPANSPSIPDFPAEAKTTV